MLQFIEYLKENKEWLFGGVGITAISFIVKKVFFKKQTTESSIEINNFFDGAASPKTDDTGLDRLKKITKILFIDDDTKFKVVSILRKQGWGNTKAVKDIYSLDSTDVKECDIFFVDVQGVGIALDCRDEGLGLALSLKRKYPFKKVVIYSAETKGERFHEALKKADSSLPKNAEPYEFLQLVEQFANEIHNPK